MSTSNSKPPIIIAGAGHCGGRTAIRLRQNGYQGELLLIGSEDKAPYERPPLSKEVLTGQRTPESCQLQSQADYDEQNITLLTNTRIERVDSRAQEIHLTNGITYPYQTLLIATGGDCRTLALPGHDLAGVHYLRTLNDAIALQTGIKEHAHLVVIGGGFIGLEVAASAQQRGCNVTVLEAAPQLLGRCLPSAIATAIQQRHAAAGVSVRTAAQIDAITGASHVDGVQLADGTHIKADHVVIGIGIIPNTILLNDTDISLNNGVITDEYGRTSLPNIYAAGDVANAYRPRYARHIRLESWQNAEQQAEILASNMLGGETPYDPVPWLWSNQYDWTLQTAGVFSTALPIVERKIDHETSLWFQCDNNTLQYVVGLGSMRSIAKEVRVAQLLIERGIAITNEQLIDPATPLKKYLRH